MSLLASPTNGIIIQNSSNEEKFNSNNKLLYKYFSWDRSGMTVTMGGTARNTSTANFFFFDVPPAEYDNTIFVISVYITSCTGNMGSTLLNTWIQLNVPILIHRVYDTNTAAGAYQWEIFSACVFTGPMGFNGKTESTVRFSLHSNSVVNPLSTITFYPKVKIYRHSY